MTEAAFWSGLVRPALHGLDPIRVENPALPGTPDVNYIEGWIELKQQDTWPKREDTIVKLKHDLSQEQRVVIAQRGNAGGRVHVLIKIDHDILLFDWRAAIAFVGKVNQASLKAAAQAHWTSGKKMKKELRDELFKTDITGRGLFD